ncbi:TMEM175 family protein [Actinomycetospora termitidis]|uniref:TMEM175 family protein n=1 Tax=Actinomycetospora termitidis TaxID=3053470 RepID=A0ABT7MCE4_9PSEU|nr:TMEM175 family protein [Actinomycetospora sp. Odt1-22]MDL5158340.1 TMEM175 family protein [Actinomycetospora sp. Odt1-22]
MTALGSPGLRADRLLLFSDAVAAIALTLLVLPLVDLVPEAVARHEAPVEVLARNLVALGSFVLSFFVVWRVWTVHHRLFDRTVTVSPRVVRLNALWLLCVVFLPFPAEMVASYGEAPLVPALYVGVLLASSVTLVAMAVAMRRTAPEGEAPDRADLERVAGNASCLAVAFVIVVAVPAAGYWPLLLLLVDGPVLAVVRRVRRRLALGGS